MVCALAPQKCGGVAPGISDVKLLEEIVWIVKRRGLRLSLRLRLGVRTCRALRAHGLFGTDRFFDGCPAAETHTAAARLGLGLAPEIHTKLFPHTLQVVFGGFRRRLLLFHLPVVIIEVELAAAAPLR